eukprot:2612596-Prymnesium_polylepis.1
MYPTQHDDLQLPCQPWAASHSTTRLLVHARRARLVRGVRGRTLDPQIVETHVLGRHTDRVAFRRALQHH